MTVAKLRFAALIRVSTEKQQKHGESLRNQRQQIEGAVESLGGRITEWYGGQEHATSGNWERKELDRLVADAGKKRRNFDAVIVVDAIRWSRDNARSKAGLEVFRQSGIRFFTLTQEHSLFDPNAILFLGMSAEIGEYQARQQNQKSVQSCIARAKRLGAPTAGRKPYGRIWDKKSASWSIDPEKLSKIIDVAQRYLAGESLPKLAQEHNLNHSFLNKTLTQSCGDSYEIRWDIPALNIKETVEIAIPRLLPEDMIEAIRQKAKANRTHLHGNGKNSYLLSGFVYCGVCGYSLIGQANRYGALYYRHHPRSRCRDTPCPLDPSPFVRADQLESKIVDELFFTFGNPAAVERAIEQVQPDQKKLAAERNRLAKLEKQLDEIRCGRRKIIDLTLRGLPEDEAAAKLQELNDQEAEVRRQTAELAARLNHLPSPEDIRDVAKDLAKRVRPRVSMKRARLIREANYFENMTFRDQRKLVEAVFLGQRPDGRPNGIYVFPIDGQQKHRQKQWSFRLCGMIPNFTGIKVGSFAFNPIDGLECVAQLPSG